MLFALVCATTVKKTCNKDLSSFDQSRRALYWPIRNYHTTANHVRVNNSSTSHAPSLLVSLLRRLPECKPHAELYYIFLCQKYAINIPISTGALKSFEKSLHFQNSKFSKFLGPFFGPIFNLRGSYPYFSKLLRSFHASTNVSTSFHTSFFTVISSIYFMV